MDCQQAREQIDQRLQEQAEGKADGRRDWSELDAHLAGCPKCSADWLELLRTRNLLTPLAREEPTPKEVDSMWQAIQSAGPGPVQTIGRPTRRGLYRYLAACAGIAAVLFIAFQLGTWQYGTSSSYPDIRGLSGGDALTTAKSGWTPEYATSTASTREHADEPSAQPTLSAAYVAAGREPGAANLYEVPPGEDTLATTDALRMLLQTGQIGLDQLISPSSADVNVNGLADQETDERFADLGQASYGYEVPFADAEGGGRTSSIAVGTEFDATPPPALPRLLVPVQTGEGEQAVDRARLEETGASLEEAVVRVRFDMARASVRGMPVGVWGTLSLADLAPEEREELRAMGYLAPGSNGAPQQSPRGHGEGAAGQRTDEPPASSVTGEAEAERRPSAGPAARPRAKIIRTGELAVEVTDYDAAVERIEAVVREHGGFVADGSTQEGTGGALVGRAVIRVLPERFESLFTALKAIGRVESENVKAADVTAEYVDLEARIASLRITEQRLQELVKSKSFIDKVSSLLEVEREMTRVRSQIEQLQGQLRVMADRVAMSTITVTFREPPRMVPSASMSVEVPILTDAADALAEALARLNGRLTSGKTSKRDDGTLKGDYKLQISLARFGELLDAITDLGRVEERQILDWQFGHASAPWAQRTKCYVALVLFERSRPLPAGTVRIEVDALDAALEALTSVLADCDGSITSNKTTRQKDGSSVGELKLSVPAGRFAELTEGLASLGRTTAKQVAGEAGQIVGGAASVLCELSLVLAERPRQVPVGHMAIEVAQFEAARQALSDLVAHGNIQVLESSSNQRDDGTWIGGFRLGIKAGDMEDVVARLESLGRVQSRQISGLGLGDLSRIDPDALGTLGVALAEKATISPAPERAGGSIRDRLRDGLTGLYTSLGLILYGLVVMAPWLIIMLAGAWAIMWLRRKRQPVTKATSNS